MTKRLIVVLAIAATVAILLVLAARYTSSDIDQASREPITVQLQWEPSAQFLGFYVAKQRGFYADEKLDVRFLHGGPNVNPIANIAQRNAQVGLATADQVLRWNDSRRDDLLEAFGTVFSRSLAVFMVRANAGITSPTDFRSKRIGVFPSYDTESLLWLILAKAGVPRSEVKQINFPNFANFERGDVDAFGAYLINEPVLARLRGLDIELIDPRDSSIRFYSDTLIARQDYFREHRGQIEAFVRASLRGWEAAESDLEGALNDMKQQVGGIFGPGEPWDHQRGVGQEVVKYLRGTDGKIFVMDPEVWKEMEAALRGLDVLKRQGLVNETCDFSIVEKVHSERSESRK